jgi:hypothetical protein
MTRISHLFRFVLIAFAGSMNQRQLKAIDYLREENPVLREQIGEKRLRLNDDQRRRLAAKATRGSRNFFPAGTGWQKSVHSATGVETEAAPDS